MITYAKQSRATQAGASLVTGLLLLVVMTLLAVTGIGTARLEMLMAGNTQFMQQAYHASEAGIERRMRGSALVDGTTQRYDISNFGVDVSVDYRGSGPVFEPGFGWGEFTAYHYTLTSKAEGRDEGLRRSLRGAKAKTVQGLYYLGAGN
ncbi:MAG: PilX N-terminal domain-containing pilus assembly protein [Gammaproteobacteria bacterium]|nr:PilX N-terminal domain-containing pilus assembly protein [Gammaproteobacteria bacterium]